MRFNANHSFNIVTNGIQIAYYADSVHSGAQYPRKESIMFITAQHTSPQVFPSTLGVSDHITAGNSDAFNPKPFIIPIISAEPAACYGFRMTEEIPVYITMKVLLVYM